VVSLLGPVTIARHYYHCPGCRKGTSPRDAALGLGEHDLTPAADEAVSLAGLVDSFATGARKVLARLAGLHLSESTVQRVAESAGERVAEAQHAGRTFGPPTPWGWHKDADGKTVGYVSVDATGVGQQGPGGAKAEGRMVYVGMVYNPVPEDRARWADPNAKRHPDWKARYVAQLRPLGDLAQPLRRQAGQVGLDRADRVIALSDGGSGLEDFVRVNVPQVTAVILDFYHVAEYVSKLSKALHPGDESGANGWREATCEKLKARGGAAVLEEFRGLAVSGGAVAVRDEVVGYFANQSHRMDYPTYRAHGWQIGSGPVESACKTVIGERMKGGGMRWGSDGADAISHLRALFCSADNQWGAFWSRN
jgi:hypothetical protein